MQNWTLRFKNNFMNKSMYNKYEKEPTYNLCIKGWARINQATTILSNEHQQFVSQMLWHYVTYLLNSSIVIQTGSKAQLFELHKYITSSSEFSAGIWTIFHGFQEPHRSMKQTWHNYQKQSTISIIIHASQIFISMKLIYWS